MKKLICLLTIIGISNFLFANNFASEKNSSIHSSFTYGDIGIGPLPLSVLNLSIGRRSVLSERMALDGGATLATLIRWNIVLGNLNGLWYFNRDASSQYYMGLGGSAGCAFGFDEIYHYIGVFVSPNIVFGKEFFTYNKSKRFFQIEFRYPLYSITEKELIYQFPFISMKYGFAF